MSSFVTFNGEPIRLGGDFPRVGDTARSFMLVGRDLKDISLSQYAGYRKIISIIPSIDTAVCATSTRRLNTLFSQLPEDVVILVISSDMPFAQSRFCGAEGLNNLQTLSTMRGRDFAKDYGVMITEPPLAGLMARALLVLDANDKVLYAELVSAIEKEPDYLEALKVLHIPLPGVDVSNESSL
jgi:thioredoxin-dependent peroxiredoxin